MISMRNAWRDGAFLWPLLAMVLIGLGCKEPLDLDATLFHCDENNPCAESAGYECQYPVLDNGQKADKGECRKGPPSTDSTGSDTGTDVVTDTGSDTGSDVVTDTGSDTSSDTGGTPCNDDDECQDGVPCTHDQCIDGVCNYEGVNSGKYNEYRCCGIPGTDCKDYLSEGALETLEVYGCGDTPDNLFNCIYSCKATYVDVDGDFANGCEVRILRVDQESGKAYDSLDVPQGADQPDGSEEKPFKRLSTALWKVSDLRDDMSETPNEPHFIVQLEKNYEIAVSEDFSGRSGPETTSFGPLTLSNITLQGSSKDVVLSRKENVSAPLHRCVLEIGKSGSGAPQTKDVTIRNLTIDGTMTSFCGIDFVARDGTPADQNYKAEDLIIKNTKGRLGDHGYGIRMDNGGNVDIRDVEIHHIYAGADDVGSGPAIRGASFGIWVSKPNDGQAAVTIGNSLIHDIMGYGFHPDGLEPVPDDRGSVGIYVDNISDITIEHCSIHSIYSTVSIPPDIDTEIYPVAAIYLRNSATSGNHLTLAHLSIWNVGLMTLQDAGTSRAYGIAVDNSGNDQAYLEVANSIISRIGHRGGGESCGLCVADLHLDAVSPTPAVPTNLVDTDAFEYCGCSIDNSQSACGVGDDTNSPPLFDLGELDSCIEASVEALMEMLKACSLPEPAHETCPADNPFVDCSCGQFPQLRLAPTSAAIDAGDPISSGVCIEPEPNGCVVNLGHYGGTSEAQVAKDGTHLGPTEWTCEEQELSLSGKDAEYCISPDE